MHDKDEPPDLETTERSVTVFIDGASWTVTAGLVPVARVRTISHPPIGPERDLWLALEGEGDLLLSDGETVELSDGCRFFTAPRTVLAGHVIAGSPDRVQDGKE